MDNEPLQDKGASVRVCRKCLAAEQAQEILAEMERFLEMLRPEDRASDELFQKRIAVCRGCEQLLGATCNACGCYVEFRANVKHGRCPKKKWQAKG